MSTIRNAKPASTLPQRLGVSLPVARVSRELPPATAPSLRRGSTGAQVREVQRKLQALRFLSGADVATGPGVFGPRTEIAVKQFQIAQGLRPTGVVGQYTQAALSKALAAHSSNSINPFAVGANQRRT